MKNIVILGLSLLLATLSSGQDLQIDSLGFETFEMTEGDTTYTMKKYFMAFLKKGPHREHSPDEAALIQKGHMDHMNKMAEAKQISIAGPFGDDGEMRGIIILMCLLRKRWSPWLHKILL